MPSEPTPRTAQDKKSEFFAPHVSKNWKKKKDIDMYDALLASYQWKITGTSREDKPTVEPKRVSSNPIFPCQDVVDDLSC